MTDERFAEIRARHLAKSFHDQYWWDMEAMLSEADRQAEGIEELRGEISYLAVVLCDVRGGHDWEDYDEPDKSVEGQWQRCMKCKASRLQTGKVHD